MELALGCVYLAILTIALLLLTSFVCVRNKALWPWRNFLKFAAILWLALALGKKAYIDDVFPPSDGLEHEAVARNVSDLITTGRFADAFSYLSAGNPAYQFTLGVFYAVSGAPEVITYAINGAFGFCGLLALLEILCRQSNCTKLPLSAVIVVSLLPSAMLWTTTNLKEGVVLWGICTMCYWTIPANRFTKRPPRMLPVIGFLVVMSMRPHIAIAWLLAIGAGALIHTKRYSLLFAAAAGTVASIALLSILAPTMFEQSLEGGVSSTLSDHYDTIANSDSAGGTAITGGNSVPIVSGLSLILIRPWPTEAQHVEAFLAGVEVWGLAAFGILNWCLLPSKRRWRLPPELVTHIVLLLLMSYFFSYMYNMGLVVRQRLMCFPAVLSLYLWPLLVKHQNRLAVAPRALHQRMVRPRHVRSRIIPNVS